MTYRACKCKWCGKSLDRNTEDWVETKSSKGYAHTECDEYRNKIHEYCKNKYGTLYFKTQIDKQIQELAERGKTISGIYKTLVWWYDINGGDPSQSHGSIRIVGYVYGDCLDYYQKKWENEQKNANVNLDEIFNEDNASEFTIHPQPISKPKRVNLFNIS